MKILLPIIAGLGLAACAQTGQAPRSYGNDALPSAEAIAARQVGERLNYADARIEYDANYCAYYQGTAPDGQVKREPLLDAAGKHICVRK